MFCTNCGADAKDAVFCPKCGSKIITDEAMNQFDTAESQATPQVNQSTQPQFDAQMNQSTQPQFGAQVDQGMQPQFGAQMNQGAQPQFGAGVYGMPEAQPGSTPPVKKKKKWPKVVGIIVAIVAVLGVAAFFLWPTIVKIIDPKQEAISALKSVGKESVDAFDSVSGNLSSVSKKEKQKITGTIKLDKANMGSDNISTYLKANCVNYDVSLDLTTMQACGTLGLADNSGKDIITLTFFTDTNNVYFKCPELFTESFKIPVSTYTNNSYGNSISGSMRQLSGITSFLNSDLSVYTDIIKAVVNDVLVGFNTFVENCEYKKIEEASIATDGGEIKANGFLVTANKDAILKGINATIDALYADSKVSSYMSLLSGFGLSQQTIKTQIEQEMGSVPPISFKMYTKSDKIRRISIDSSMYGVQGDLQTISVDFLGKDEATEHVVFSANVKEMTMKMDIVSKKDNAKFEFEMAPDQKRNPGEYVKFGAEFTTSGSTINSNMYVNGVVGMQNIDAALSNTSAVATFDTMPISASNFSSAIDVSRMTTAQENKLSTELLGKTDILYKIFTDKGLAEIMGSSISESKSSNATAKTPSTASPSTSSSSSSTTTSPSTTNNGIGKVIN